MYAHRFTCVVDNSSRDSCTYVHLYVHMYMCTVVVACISTHTFVHTVQCVCVCMCPKLLPPLLRLSECEHCTYIRRYSVYLHILC